MTKPVLPFPLPKSLPSDLAQVLDVWENLKRGENPVPFADDVKLSALPGLADRLMLVEAFDHPQRFRFNIVGQQIRNRHGADLAGKFADEIDATSPFEYLTAQGSVTVEARAPTHYDCGPETPHGRYARLLLPLWGNGRVELLLGVISFV